MDNNGYTMGVGLNTVTNEHTLVIIGKPVDDRYKGKNFRITHFCEAHHDTGRCPTCKTTPEERRWLADENQTQPDHLLTGE